ncbi:MAG: choice-of-anchor B family protein, partial [Acidimicrobiales bacterium]
ATNKQAPVALSALIYDGLGYTHQGWLTEDQAYFVVDDELDELDNGHTTRTRVFDVSDPANPNLVGFYEAETAAVDHNLYIVHDLVYMANYRSGLRILALDDPSTASLSEVGFFDTVPADDLAEFAGAFTAYPFFESGVVVVSSMEEGLFVLRPQLPGS